MTKALHPPESSQQLGRTKQRVHALERALRKHRTPPGYRAKFSLHGRLFLSESGPEVHPDGGTLQLVWAVLRVAGTTATVLSLRKNGVEFDQLTLAVAAKYAELPCNTEFRVRQDQLTIAIITAGADAREITVYGGFDR